MRNIVVAVDDVVKFYIGAIELKFPWRQEV